MCHPIIRTFTLLQHLDTNHDQQNSSSWMDFLISWAALPLVLRATSRMCEQFEIWEHHPLWETSAPSVLITCSQTEADITSDEYERRTVSLLTMIYSSRATAGKICKTDCWFSDLIVSIALSLKHSDTVCSCARDCSSLSLFPPSTTSPQEKAGLLFFFCFFLVLPLFTSFFVLACHIISLSDDEASPQAHNEEVVKAHRLVSLQRGYRHTVLASHCSSINLFDSWEIFRSVALSMTD